MKLNATEAASLPPRKGDFIVIGLRRLAIASVQRSLFPGLYHDNAHDVSTTDGSVYHVQRSPKYDLPNGRRAWRKAPRKKTRPQG